MRLVSTAGQAGRLHDGEVAGCKAYDGLIDRHEKMPNALLADKGYSIDAIRTTKIKSEPLSPCHLIFVRFPSGALSMKVRKTLRVLVDDEFSMPWGTPIGVWIWSPVVTSIRSSPTSIIP